MLLTVFATVMLMDLQSDLTRGTGVVELPAGETHLSRPLEFPPASKRLTLKGNPAGSTLVIDPDFTGVAAILVRGATDVTLSGFSVQGNRKELKSNWYLPTGETPFADFYTENGIVVRGSVGVTIHDVSFKEIRAFPILINSSSKVEIEGVTIAECGTLNPAGRNNTTGGILLEQGVSRFEIRKSSISRITGNAIWTHSYASAPRQSDGKIRENSIATVGRDAIQIGHATHIRVENNTGVELGFPVEIVDVENHGIAVALDTAGNVDHSVYRGNHFTDVNGQCIDLDGFHDGEVSQNSCLNRQPLKNYPASHFGIVFGNNDPGMDSTGVVVTRNTIEGFAYGAVFLVGSRNRVENNRFTDMNRAHCGSGELTALCSYEVNTQPDLLRSGVYLSANGGRGTVTRENVIRGNLISGFGMDQHCFGSSADVQLQASKIEHNTCQDNNLNK